MTLEELRRHAARTQSDAEYLDREVEDAADEALRAQMAGNDALKRKWQERADQLQAAADRAWDKAEEVEEAVAEAEYEAEYPEEAAAERAPASSVQTKELLATLLQNLLRDGKITSEVYSKMTGTRPRP